MRLIDENGKLLGKLNLIDGLALFLFLFTAVLLAQFSYYNLFQHHALTLERAEPRIFVPGRDQMLKVFGNGFKENLQVQVDGENPPRFSWTNEVRIDIQLKDDLAPGPHILMFRDPRGRKVVRDDLFRIMWQPEVEQIHMEERHLARDSYRIIGKYFEKGGSVHVGGAPAYSIENLSSREILISIPSVSRESPWTELIIENPGGGRLVLRGEELLEKFSPEKSSALPEPQVARIMPRQIPLEQEAGVLVLGFDLKAGCTVRIGNRLLERLEWTEPHVVMGTLPARSLAPGIYPLEVTNPNGKSTKIDRVIDVTPRETVGNLLEKNSLTKPSPEGDPRIEWLVPHRLITEAENGVMLLGFNLKEGCTVRIGDRLLERLEWHEPNTVLGVLPAHTLAPGVYPVEVSNPDGKSVKVNQMADLISEKNLLKKLRRKKDVSKESSYVPLPAPRRMAPRQIQADQDSSIVVIGSDLAEGCLVRIGNQPLQRVEWRAPHIVYGLLPAGSVVPGTHDLEVTNPNGKSGKLKQVVDIVSPKKLDLELRFQGTSRQELRELLGEELRTPFIQILKILDKGKKNDSDIYAKVRLPVDVKGSKGGYPFFYCYGPYKLQTGMNLPIRVSKEREIHAVLNSVTHPKKWSPRK